MYEISSEIIVTDVFRKDSIIRIRDAKPVMTNTHIITALNQLKRPRLMTTSSSAEKAMFTSGSAECFVAPVSVFCSDRLMMS